MGILTSKDMPVKGDEEKEQASPASIPSKKEVSSKTQFKWPVAPKGKSAVTVLISGEEVKLELDDQVYTVPDKKVKEAGFLNFRKALLDNGFEDISKAEVPEGTNPPKIGNAKSWTLGHPDNEADMKVNGNYGIKLKDGTEIVCPIKDGVIKIDNREAAELLMNIGFYLVKEEKK